MEIKTIWTDIGLAKRANSEVLGTLVDITHMAFGDAGGNENFEPTQDMLALVNEVYRRPVDSIAIEEDNPAWVGVEGHILAQDGGWWVREIGLIDSEGDLVAVGNCSPRYKPILAEGEATDLYFRLILLTSNTAVIHLKVDPTVAIASKKYVDDCLVESGDGPPVTLDVGGASILRTHGTIFLPTNEGVTTVYYLPAYASLSSRKRFKIKNIGQGVGRLSSPLDNKLIDDELILDLNPGDRCELAKDGVNWQTL